MRLRAAHNSSGESDFVSTITDRLRRRFRTLSPRTSW
jgi:hypothetical protein